MTTPEALKSKQKMKKNLHQTLLLKAIRKTGCEPIDVRKIEENLIEMSLLPPDSEIPVKSLFKIIPWQKCLGDVVTISGQHKGLSRQLHKKKTKYFLAFVYSKMAILVRPYDLPSSVKSYPSADEEFYTMIVDLKTDGKKIKI